MTDPPRPRESLREAGDGKLTEPAYGESLYQKSIRKFRRDKFGLFGLAIVSLYGLVALGVFLGLFCTLDDSMVAVGPQHVRPGETYTWHEFDENHVPTTEFEAKSLFGTDVQGFDVFTRLIYSIKQAFSIGALVAVFSVLIGLTLGTISGYFPGPIDDRR